MVHCHVVRQTCTIVSMDKEYLRAGDKCIIKFKFMKKPEYMHIGDTILFREGRTRGKGKVIKLFPLDLSVYEKEKKNSQMKKQKFREKKNNENKEDKKDNNNDNNKGKNSYKQNLHKKKEG